MNAPRRYFGRFGRALVGLHDAEPNAGLLGYVAQLARTGIVNELVFVHVSQTVNLRDNDSMREQVLATLKADVGLHLGSLPVSIEYELRFGPLPDQFLAAVAEHQIELVVIGHRPDHPMQRSLARRLARLSPCSVWLVPDGSATTISRILAPIDFSPAAGYALEAAASVAVKLGIQEITAAHIYFDETRTTYEGMEAAIRGRELHTFEEFVAGLDLGGIRVASQFVEGVHPAEAIQQVAEVHGMDLVVMGTRGHSASAAVLIGSTAEDTLVLSRVPVLVVRAPGRQVGLFRALMEVLWKHKGGQFD